MTTRLENLVCAVLQSGIVQPLAAKIATRVYGDKIPAKPTLEQYEKFSASHDAEVALRAVNIASNIAALISDIELKELEPPAPRLPEPPPPFTAA